MKTISSKAAVKPEETQSDSTQPLMRTALASLERVSANSASLIGNFKANFQTNGKTYILPRFLYIGPRGGDAPIRIGLFAALWGDERDGTCALVHLLELLEENPAIATGYCLCVYPVCNPVEFEGHSDESNRRELTAEFWKASARPSVRLLQSDIAAHALHGGIVLRSEASLDAFHGVATGAVLTQHLINPAIAAAGKYLPIDQRLTIKGKRAADGVIWNGGWGLVSAPPAVRPQPFEISLCAPREAPEYLKQYAWLTALQTILREYREFIAYARNI